MLVALTLRQPEVPTYAPTHPAPKDAGRTLVGPVLYTVDATASDRWRYFSLRLGAVVENPGPVDWGNIGRHSTFIEHLWQPLLAQAGLRYRKPHSMRHTFATWALEGNEEKGIPPVPIQHVRDWLGHASVEETERYLHVERARHARAVDYLDAYVSA